MENPSTHLDKERRPLKAARRSLPDRRWTLLFIGDHGRVITLKRFKSIVFITAVVLVIAMGATAVLFLRNQGAIARQKKLAGRLARAVKKIQDLRHEKDILTARLVLAQSRLEETRADKPAMAAAKTAAARPKIKPPVTAVPKPVPAPPQTAPPADSPPPAANLSVDVENFHLARRPGGDRLQIQFKIKNTSPGARKVAGHTIVVLKGDEIPPAQWMAVPRMGLVEGRPDGKSRGYSFGINYFRTMKFTSRAPAAPEKYNRAAVYVFSLAGDLLLEKDFPVTIPGNSPASVKSSQSGPQVPSAPAVAVPKGHL